jgi:predicted RNase H-like HicB family nuclease
MASNELLAYWVTLSRDEATNLVVAEVPALGIADDGIDEQEALANIETMLEFHLDCLIEEGQSIPVETRTGPGFYLHVTHPARAA